MFILFVFKYLSCQIIICFVYFAGSDSDISEETLVGNVNKLTVVPQGYYGKPKQGYLTFDACFESGKYSVFFCNS